MVDEHPFFLPSIQQVSQQIAETREVMARTVELLKQLPKPDSFAGRKTQEPFPREQDGLSTET